MDDNETFPVKNDAACVFKWGWNTFRFYTGKSSSCHRVESTFIPIDQFENFHNMPMVIDDRTRMLNNQWPQSGRGCEYCLTIEQSGGLSDRLYHNQRPGETPLDFDLDVNPYTVTPRVMEVYLDNYCNLGCIYCRPEFSSIINNELKKLGPIKTINQTYMQPLESRRLYFERFVQWLEDNQHSIRRLSVQGGEPLIQKEFFELIEFLENNNNPNLELAVNTNLNYNTSNLEKLLPRIRNLIATKKIKRFDINCSLDCWGEQQEFVRYGINLTQWIKNFEYLIQHKWLYINVQSTVMSLTIKTLPELQKILNEYLNLGAKFYHTFYHVDGTTQEIFDPIMFGKDFFANDLKKAIDLAPCRNESEQLEKDKLIGIAKYTCSRLDIDRKNLEKFHYTIDSISERRGIEWKTLFPEIENFFVENNITKYVV